MEYRYTKILTLPIIFFIVSCTYYNSDKVNTELIQGKWQLMGVDHNIYDTVSIDYTNEQTFLIFEGDKCTQFMPDLRDTLILTFSIHDYQLAFLKDSILVNLFNIDTLTQNTLILSHETNERIYKKIKQ